MVILMMSMVVDVEDAGDAVADHVPVDDEVCDYVEVDHVDVEDDVDAAVDDDVDLGANVIAA